MPSQHYPHLEITRLVPAPPRRKGGGGGTPVHKHENVHEHGDGIGRQFQGAEQNLSRQKPLEFDPGLLLRLRIQAGTVTEDALRSFGIDIIAEESDETLVVFVSEEAKQEFLGRLARYRAGQTGRGVSANVFHAIEEVGVWRREDRVGRTLQNDAWSSIETKVVDIELWPRDSVQANRRACDQTVSWLNESGAEVWDQLASTAVVLIRTRLTGALLDEALELETVRVIELPPALNLESMEYDAALEDISIEGPGDTDTTTVAILDSGVVAGHPLISPAVAEEMSFVPGLDPTDETGHGSAVAGFAIYGDVENCIRQKRFVATLRLLSGKVLSGDMSQYDRRLIANQVIDAVNYFNGQLGCRIFNISFGDAQQPYDGRHVKGLAAILDTLARERDIIFVVSAGNFKGTEDVPEDWRKDYPRYLFKPEARIIDPAPALNAITVGSLARYDADRLSTRYPRDVNHQPIARVDELSPFTRTGPGPNGAIKPELVEYGGNVSVDLRIGDGPRFQPADPNISEMAVKHSYVGDRLFVPVIGTSFAAPKISHIAAHILREYPDASANLVRALLLLNATPPDNALALLEASGDAENQSFYGYGYGRPDFEKTLYSLETCVTLVAEERIGADQTHFFEILLPQEFLSTGSCNRSIRIALAHCPPCRSTRKTYKGSKISFKVVAENDIETLEARFRADSTLKNIVEWGPLTPGNQLRSKGTAMKASKTIKLLPSTSSLLNGKRLFVVVTHQVEIWAKDLVQDEEPYALAFAIEDRARNDIQLYAQLRAKLRQRVRARV
jgi:subtilisin family serine protease